MDDVLPSQTASRPWIHVSSPNKSDKVTKFHDLETLKKETKVGKWLLFNRNRSETEGELSPHDKAWLFIKSLVLSKSNTVLIGAKCSTVWKGKYAGASTSQGVICCYTADYTDKEAVKKAADAIREVCTYPRDMYYKTDCTTYAEKYTKFGDSAVSIYKHTINNIFFERDHASKNWVLQDF